MAASHFTLRQGNNISFNIALKNGGNIPVLAALTATGPLSIYVSMEENVFLAVGETVNVTILLSNTRILETKDYDMVINIITPGGIEKLEMKITVLSATGSSDDQTKGTGAAEVMWLWIAIAALCVIILCFIIFLIRKKKDDEHRKEELELLEAEIVLPPPPPPTSSTMETFQALPQYSGKFGYGMMGAPQLGTQSYIPTDGLVAKQLPPAGGQPTDHIPPPPLGGLPPSAPAPSVYMPNIPRKEDPSNVLMKLPPAPISRVQVPRIFAPPTVSPVPQGSQNSSTPPPVSPTPPSSIEHTYSPVGSQLEPASIEPTNSPVGSQPEPASIEPTYSPAGNQPEPASIEPQTGLPPQGENPLDNLTRLLSKMPSTLDQPKPPGQAPGY